MTEDEMVGWHEFEQAPGVGDGQGGLLQSMELQRVRHTLHLTWRSVVVTGDRVSGFLREEQKQSWG